MTELSYSDALNPGLESGDTEHLKIFHKQADERIQRMKAALKSDDSAKPAATVENEPPCLSPRPARRCAMRGMGRVLKRGRIWHIAFYHRGEEIRESSGSEHESAARKLLKRRLAETQTGRFIA
jgi:hypothetical protein